MRYSAIHRFADMSARKIRPFATLIRGKAAEGFRLRLSGTTGDTHDVMHTRGATPDGALSIAAVDRSAQEDARQLHWTGTGAAELMALPGGLYQRLYQLQQLEEDEDAAGQHETTIADGDAS